MSARAWRQRKTGAYRTPPCRDCRHRPCDCAYTCTVCGATRVGAPNHPGGKCPDELG